MKSGRFAILIITVSASHLPAKETPEEAAEQERYRAAIPLGGNFDPHLEEGVFIAAGHSMNVVASRDDGKTWEPVFYGRPCGDHGRGAVWNSVTYTNGVVAIAAGWGAPGKILASDDGKKIERDSSLISISDSSAFIKSAGRGIHGDISVGLCARKCAVPFQNGLSPAIIAGQLNE